MPWQVPGRFGGEDYVRPRNCAAVPRNCAAVPRDGADVPRNLRGLLRGLLCGVEFIDCSAGFLGEWDHIIIT